MQTKQFSCKVLLKSFLYQIIKFKNYKVTVKVNLSHLNVKVFIQRYVVKYILILVNSPKVGKIILFILFYDPRTDDT